MRAKCVMPDEQFRLVTECRQSGLSDYQWCQMHDVKPGTFYNWISRLRKKGYAIPKSSVSAVPAPVESQEVVRVNLIPDHAGTAFPSNLTGLPQNRVPERNESPAAEIVIGGTTVRFFAGTDPEMLDSCIGIYIPSTQNIYTPTDNKEETELVQARFSLWFGGYSTYVINGGYRGKAGNVITEETTLIRSYCTAECLREKICDVFELASFLQKKMKQESIAIEVNGAMILMY